MFQTFDILRNSNPSESSNYYSCDLPSFNMLVTSRINVYKNDVLRYKYKYDYGFWICVVVTVLSIIILLAICVLKDEQSDLDLETSNNIMIELMEMKSRQLNQN